MNLNDKTTIPLVAAIAALPFIVGVILWLTSIDAKATKGAASTEVIYEVRDRVIRIEALLEQKK